MHTKGLKIIHEKYYVEKFFCWTSNDLIFLIQHYMILQRIFARIKKTELYKKKRSKNQL